MKSPLIENEASTAFVSGDYHYEDDDEDLAYSDHLSDFIVPDTEFIEEEGEEKGEKEEKNEEEEEEEEEVDDS